jgi:hypothetical protein
MKLSQYAKQIGINYRTARRWFKLGQIDDFDPIIIERMNDSYLANIASKSSYFNPHGKELPVKLESGYTKETKR